MLDPDSAIYLLGIIGTIFLGSRVTAWVQILGFSMRMPVASYCERSDIPEVVLTVIEAGEEELLGLGFEPSHALRTTQILAKPEDPSWELVYYHPEECSYATSARSSVPNAVWSRVVTFVALHPDGLPLQTHNRAAHGVVPGYDGWILNDPFTADVMSQWRSHLEAVREAERNDARWRARRKLTPRQHIEAANRWTRGYFEFLVDREHASIDGDVVRFRPWTASWFSRQLARGDSRTAKLQQKLAGNEATLEPDDETLVATQVRSFRAAETQDGPRLGGFGKLGLFLGTALLFGFAFGLTISIEFVISLFAVLLFHELGHVFGMWLFGYRDVQILFLPFLGAAALGTKRTPRAMERVIIYLLGPVPGLLLACAYFAAPAAWTSAVPFLDTEVAKTTAYLLLFLNYVNLLPFLPFDGGQLLNAAVFDRFPRAKFAFVVASTVAMALGAWALEDIALAFLTLVLGIGLVQQYREMMAVLSLKREGVDTADRDVLLMKVFGELNQRGIRKRPFSAQRLQAKAILERFENPVASLPETFVTLAMYAALVIVPPVVTFGAISLRSVDEFTVLSDYSENRARQCLTWYASFESKDCPAPDWWER